MGRMLHGISPHTGLPRFVIRIKAGGRAYYYFRFKDVRERLPDLQHPAFAGTYSTMLLAQGLALAATKPARPLRSIKRREVYFIENEDAGLIKIGVSKWPVMRLQNLQIGNSSPLRLIRSFPGDEQVERQWHQRFATLRIRGEWFRATPELRAAIDGGQQ